MITTETPVTTRTCTYCGNTAGPMTVRTLPGQPSSPVASRDHQQCYEAHMQALRTPVPAS